MAVSQYVGFFLVAFLAASFDGTAEEEFTSGLVSVVDRDIPVVAHADAKWDYSDGPNGPAHWGELEVGWEACSTGTNQGPWDVEEDLIHYDGSLDVPAKVYYKPAPAIVRLDGKTIEVDWAGGIFNVHNYDYVLDKLVFHAPSEHTYYGERFALEVQFVHTHPTEGYAINSIVFKEGKSNEWLEQFLHGFSSAGNDGIVSYLQIDSAGVEGEDLDWNRYFRYLGSLTTPPCSERPVVVWSLLKAPLTASKEQIAVVQAVLLNKPNVRPLQPIGRNQFYFPKSMKD